MLEVIEEEVAYTSHAIGKNKLDARVMEAMRKVPRHKFVPANSQIIAYSNGPLSIGHGQTISQPYIVALMTDLLEPQPDDVILEIGTGSGYQSAILSCLVKQVHTTETVSPLVDPARERLQRLGYNNVEVHECDGYYGLPDQAPFDGIIVTAAAPHVPAPLLEQLKPGGRLVIPVGHEYYAQELLVIQKQEDNHFTRRKVIDVVFVPLTGNGHHQAAEDID
ncbi:MAG: protein-L-isoaspartate(D-aspartate) O-methyltransferase [Gammaproteobacteria bacterium]|nr:protein-L-isoaspartate(D-aspartate) O-methyltransferase [Gammaproteobacteria bacterium]